MVTMAQIAISLEEINSQFQTDISTRSPAHHATPRCSQHLVHLAHPHHFASHPPETRTTTPIFHLPTAKTTTVTLRSMSHSLLRPTRLYPVRLTAPTTEEDNLVADVLTDGAEEAMVEVRHLVVDEVITLNGPETVSI
jgi:hypothetical protein